MKKITVIALILGLMVGFGTFNRAEAVPLIDWDITLDGKNVDSGRAGNAGVDFWAKWTYTVTATANTGSDPGEFTHLGIFLPLSGLDYDAAVEAEILASVMIMNASSVDVTSLYDTELKTGGGPLSMGERIQFNNLGDLVTTLGDYNTFMFSTPYATTVDVALGIKQGGTREFGLIGGVGERAEPESVPEPGIMLLLASGLFGLAGISYRRKKQSA